MAESPFQTLYPPIGDKLLLREPQREAYAALEELANGSTPDREIGVVLPVGCGKSGCITLAPFAFRAGRVLVVAPGVRIAGQLYDDFNPSLPDCFYTKTKVLTGPPYPEPVEIRGTTTNRADLDEADVVITNIQQLQGEENRWLGQLPEDYFDLILFDEGHRSVAATWESLKAKFPRASVVNFSATPLRADGRKMAGRIVYSYPVFRAIEAGYVKRLKALVLNPKSLRYVRHGEHGEEIEVPLDELRRLGEEDAEFRRSIVTSQETLNSIVDASIRELYRLRDETGENRIKIIASALHHDHCQQVVAAYRARALRADYVHSREGPANEKVLARLENHELDVIVQVRKLGEGFDHPYLAVAAVFSIFANLSPFVQFVGRIMRVIVQNSPGHMLNQGTVVYHAGANVAQRWDDFREFSEADRDYFDQLLPAEELSFADAGELTVTPAERRDRQPGEVREQGSVLIEEVPLLSDDEAMAAIEMLRSRGYSPEDVSRTMRALERLPVPKVRERQALRAQLDAMIRNRAAQILRERGINTTAYEFDRSRLGRTNFVVLKSAIDRHVNQAVGRGPDERNEFTRADLDTVLVSFEELVAAAEEEVFDATS